MKKILLYGILMIYMISTVTAQALTTGVGSIDTECQANGFSWGIAKYQCGSTTPDEGDGSTITVSWATECVSVDWTANPAVQGVLTKEATNTYVHPGGTSGTVTKTGQNAISHITFCGREPVTTTTIPEMAEFGSLSVLLAVLLTAPGIAYMLVRKRK